MAGAITLFETMEATYCMPYMMREMKALTNGHPIAEIMLMFAFCYMVEGASGFGTPVALGAPMLVSTGHPAFQSVVVLLVFNSFATVWGAVGTPIWFGFGILELSEDEFLEISRKAAVALGVGGFLLVPVIMTVLVPFALVRHNILFVISSLCSCIGPSWIMAFFNYEFPSLLGGLLGCGLTATLISFKVGLRPMDDDHHRVIGRDVEDIGSVSEHHGVVCKWHRSTSNISELSGPGGDGADKAANSTDTREEAEDDRPPPETFVSGAHREGTPDAGEAGGDPLPVTPSLRDHVEEHLGPRNNWKEGYLRDITLRTFPIWAVVLMLILTRVEQIGIKQYLTMQEPYFQIYLGTWGRFRCSASVVLQLRDILSYPIWAPGEGFDVRRASFCN
jgi:hypothetical protein